MMSSSKLADYIIRRISVLNLTKKEVAKRAGISRQCLYNVLGEKVEESKLSTLIKLSRVLEVHPLDLMRRLFHGWQLPIHRPSGGTKYPLDCSGFVRDVTIPDNSIISINQQFEKIWEIQNLGKEIWRRRQLVCVDDDLIILRIVDETLVPVSDYSLLPLERKVPIPVVKPGNTALISVMFRAPPYPCTTLSHWKMVDQCGEYCFPGMEGLSCKVIVSAV